LRIFKMERDYKALIATAKILPEWQGRIADQAKRLQDLLPRYEGFFVDPALLAVIHYRECANNFNRQLLNGEEWNKRTTLVPQGIGPFGSFTESTYYAVLHHGLQQYSEELMANKDNVHNALVLLEKWNGMGYAKRDKQSPYVWSGTNHGVGTGKYVADGTYSEEAVDAQCGAGTLYLVMKGVLDLKVKLELNQTNERVLELQKLLVGYGYDLELDGLFGPKTKAAAQEAFGI